MGDPPRATRAVGMELFNICQHSSIRCYVIRTAGRGVSAAHVKVVTSHTSHRLHFSTQMAAPTEHFREQAALTRVDRASSRSEKGQYVPCSPIILKLASCSLRRKINEWKESDFLFNDAVKR